tara:strand:+ start:39 stop:830 length:792 start_codon:yes stop_codon:yes gene_type:complete
MEHWQDQSVILAVRAHGENGAIVSLLTHDHGRQAGYMNGANSKKTRGTLEVGNIVDAQWRSRTSENLGTLNLELSRSTAGRIMQDAVKLAALQSACALCDQALPEREGHPGLFNGLCALLEILESDVWAPAYIMWEVALLKELGFALELSKCAGGGNNNTLAYVSPKTGRAVSYEAGEPYKDKLLPLPGFLCSNGGPADDQDILTGLQLTGFFLEHWVFAHHNRGIPEARRRLALRFAEYFDKKQNDNLRDTDSLGSELHAAG